MKELLKVLGIFLSCVFFLVISLFTYIVFTEYNPAPVEEVDIITKIRKDIPSRKIQKNTPISILSWNIGYGALGDNATFFMDGGEDVYSSDKKRINENLNDIILTVQDIKPDIVCFQEIDINSNRSYKINEVKEMHDRLGIYDYSFAYNFNVSFVPYPIPPIGRVKSGLQTLSTYQIDKSLRVNLPCIFKVPVRYFNLKRALLVTKYDIENSDKELIIINLHLEAYDNGEGKIAQTKELKNFLNIQQSYGNYVIAVGDFNQTPDFFKDIHPLQPATWHPGEIPTKEFDEYQVLFDKDTPSCRSVHTPYIGARKDSFQYYIIDGAIVSSNINVIDFKVLNYNFHCSDHNPVFLKFSIDD